MNHDGLRLGKEAQKNGALKMIMPAFFGGLTFLLSWKLKKKPKFKE